jgi:hypothetical protein
VYFTDRVLAARAAIKAPKKRDEAPRRSLDPEEAEFAKGFLLAG